MENYKLPVWIATILGCVLIVFIGLLSVNELQLIKDGSQFLSVAATGNVESTQDLAIVTVGVVSDGTTAQIVKEQNNNKMNQVIAFLKKSGINDKDIKTSQYSVAPKYNYSNQQQNLIGYQANQNITIKIHAVDKSSQQLDSIIDGVVANGANQIQGVDFSFEDSDMLLQNARKQAIDKAIVNAKQIAHDAGLELGKIVNVITTASNNPEPIFAQNFGLAKAAAPTQIQLGSQTIAVTLTVVFKIK